MQDSSGKNVSAMVPGQQGRSEEQLLQSILAGARREGIACIGRGLIHRIKSGIVPLLLRRGLALVVVVLGHRVGNLVCLCVRLRGCSERPING